MRKIEKISLSLSTVAERSMFSFCRIFFNFLGLNSKVVGLFIDFLLSGLDFVPFC